MNVDLFSYDLPEALIAQHPLEQRDSSRLLVLNRQRSIIEDNAISELSSFLHAGDLLVYNDTRVFPARLRGVKPTGGQVEVFLIPGRKFDSEAGEEVWQCLYKSSKPVKPGLELTFGDMLAGEVVTPSSLEPGKIKLTASGGKTVRSVIEFIGQVPLPPYIKRSVSKNDRERYQTIFAGKGNDGAVAAPTAGLHFSPDLLTRIKQKGVKTASLTLHVGLGTFVPVKASKVEDHQIHEESYRIPATTLDAIADARSGGKRVIAVGTTVTRALEYYAKTNRTDGFCNLFIYPGFKFKLIDALITNFHLPRSTLLMLVAAFAGHQFIMDAYEHAIRQKYRFYSYGDGMLII
ncbi:MAG: tRNA preQ1(34) S-adenosylmethionine ribosyltransferase-isomerase QueA [Pseudomonadota bacterium]|nr:tRNA preQ1(34) S-adenosylmethionine ribosyltransferase-isomerase QueA [Pseudomonadota bacterium]